MLKPMPAVAADAVGCREVVADGETGLLVEPRRPRLLARRVARLLGDPALAARLAANSSARQRVEALLEAGADHVVVTDEEDMAESVKSVTSGQGANLVFDPVAGPFLEKLAQAAAPGATIEHAARATIRHLESLRDG